MNQLNLFLPCAAGVEEMLCAEVLRVTNISHDEANPSVFIQRGGVSVKGSWRDALLLNLWSRLAQRVLVELSHTPYREERDLYDATSAVAWEIWFTPKETFKIDITAQHCPLKSLNFAALTIKDAVADRFRHKKGERPSVDTHWPHARIHAHLSATELTIYIDTSGEPLFKRGWREDKGEAPLKETLAAAMIAASGWDPIANPDVPLYDPCCGSGTIAIEAAQMAMRIAPGISRRFGFEKLLPYQPHVWDAIKNTAINDQLTLTSGKNIQIFGSDVSHRMADFAQRNAQRAGVADCIEFRGGDALQRLPPTDVCGVMLVNPPYGDRIDVAGIAGAHRNVADAHRNMAGAQRLAGNANGDPSGNGELEEDFFVQLARHWKQHFNGWQAWVLAPDMKLPGRMRLKESRRVPMWNGPIECRLFKFDIAKPAPRVAK